ncbi:PIG-L family deacetylase [Streptomyces sp. PSAA01]|uniref:PIG-L family deacetylase n=1 Tax=Streptomyces sp. PSAA01 TaxID=2912762 RepID=UPI001F1CA1E4|nr:PIG-L family deacetylase [Streptomyces sp. PSAA01]MCG0287981.1 PIG-L family deacetylase [Streptomyces sp. PSAA01]
MRRVVVSPHPDDAVWSCGGMFGAWAAGPGALTVVTVFDGGPAAAVRRAEDAAALAAWPVRAVGLGFPDAAHRGDRYPGPLSRRRAVHPDDAELAEAVAAALAPYPREGDLLLLPLAGRTHVDHVIARAAAERAAAGTAVQVAYYAEFPYRPPPAGGPGMEITEHRADFSAWLRGALAYRSQVTQMFGGPLRFGRALAGHARTPAVWREHRPAAQDSAAAK